MQGILLEQRKRITQMSSFDTDFSIYTDETMK